MLSTTVDAEREACWAAWQARGAARGRATRRKLLVLLGLLLAAAIVYSRWS